jgi:hypothetical protein
MSQHIIQLESELSAGDGLRGRRQNIPEAAPKAWPNFSVSAKRTATLLLKLRFLRPRRRLGKNSCKNHL